MKYLYIVAVALFSAFSQAADAQIITTFAGSYLGNGANSLNLSIIPQNQVLDAAGNIYVSDPPRHVVRKISVDGTVTVVAGNGIAGYSGDGGIATNAQLKNPFNIALDAAGNLYIADSYDTRIRKVDVNGIISTVAGNGIYGFSGDGGLATAAQLSGVTAVAADAAGNVYISDFGNDRIRKVDANNIITTVAGGGSAYGEDGLATAARLGNPLGITVSKQGELFISCLGYNTVRKVSADGIITTVAGSYNQQGGFSGDGGPATSAQFNQITGSVALDADGNIFIPDSYNNRVRKVDMNGIVTTVAGNGSGTFSGDGTAATGAGLPKPTGVAVDPMGNLYISTDFRIRETGTNTIINTIAGTGNGSFNGDNISIDSAQLTPIATAPDAAGNLYYADAYYRIRKIDTNRRVTTIAGTGISGFSGDNGQASQAQIGLVQDVIIDKTGALLFTDFIADRVRKIGTDGTITTLAGNGIRGFSGDGGPATSAQLAGPYGLATDKTGNIYVSEAFNNRIRKIDVNGTITTVAGNGTAGFSGDGGLATNAELNYPAGLRIDTAGNLIVVDGSNNRIRKIDGNGTITTVAGDGTSVYKGDGVKATETGINPLHIAIDADNNILASDYSSEYNSYVRRISPDGIITTVGGGGTTYGDGGPATSAQIQNISSLSVDAFNNIYISDYTNSRIRKISAAGALPLQLVKFQAKQSSADVLLTWQTANEINVSHFIVQRSMDGNTFASIGIVTASGAGVYDFADNSVSAVNKKVIYYRLQIVDKDGKQKYSDVAKIVYTQQHSIVSVFPNPATETIHVKGENLKSVSISNPEGKIFIRKTITTNPDTIRIADLPKGVYLLKIYSADGMATSQKLIVQ